jgi:FkbM family methyltransferase
MNTPAKLAAGTLREAISLRLWSVKQIRGKATFRLWYLKQVLAGERELRFVHCLSDSNRLTLDVGSNRGLYAVAALPYSRGVIAFEPQPHFAAFLRRHMPATVEVRECAVSDTTGTATLLMPSDPRFHAEARLSSSGGLGEACVPTLVRTARIDDIVSDDVGLIKVDVEGHELEVLNGATNLVDRCRPNLIVEIEDRHKPGAVSRALQWFERKQYRGYCLRDSSLLPFDGMGPSDRGGLPYNFIFLPNERAPTMRASILAALFAVRVL